MIENEITKLLEKEIMKLNDMSLQELKALWMHYFDYIPASSNRKFYIYRIAYRMQEITFGSIPDELKKELCSIKLSKQKAKRKIALPIPGTKIVRTYQGKEYSCTVLSNGFEYNGRYYKSLSGVAQAITNLKISGSFFFNLGKA